MKLIRAHRQPMNLKRIITSDKNQIKNKTICNVIKCGNRRCNLCEILITGNEFNYNGKIYKVKRNMNYCNAKNCVYVIICEGCKQIYIGETNNFRLRMNVHINHVKHNVQIERQQTYP